MNRDIPRLPEPKAAFLKSTVASLPPLPRTVRYYDDFDEIVRSIDNFNTEIDFYVFIAGDRIQLKFSIFDGDFQVLSKHLFYYIITEDLRISTAYHYLMSLQHVSQDLLSEILYTGPMGIKRVWPLLFGIGLNKESFMAIKWLLVFLSERHICAWSPSYLDFISSTLPLPNRDKYSKLQAGGAFLSMEEEARVVWYLTQLAETSGYAAENISDTILRECGMLMFSYLFAMRPNQIARVTMRDVRIWKEQEGKNPAIHITFYMIKQRTQSSTFPMVRRIKDDWAPLIALLYDRTLKRGSHGGARLFSAKSASEVGRTIRSLATQIVGRPIGANDMRHTAAQRLVDAGASQEEVATFLGHSDITTCLVYFESSPNQAELINQALAISPTYQRLAEIAHAGFISQEDLAELKGEQQIAGVPHGIPIAGIGGCNLGQPSCPYNPITSCYGCNRFMPLADIELHRRVLNDLRGVVSFYADASRNEKHSPANQLQRTLVAIKSVIQDLEDCADA